MNPHLLESERTRLTAVAYGVLGTRGDAEDVVQDVFLRIAGLDPQTIDSLPAYLTRSVVNTAIDRLRQLKRERASYPGPWLPEPLADTDPLGAMISGEQMTLALLAALERLDPLERAVFLLRDVFDLDYAEIVPVVERTTAACRQIAHRAREHLGTERRRHRPNARQHRRLARAFAAAAYDGDLAGLVRLLAADIVVTSDGGGKVSAATRPVHGQANSARFILGLSRKQPARTRLAPATVNGEPAFVATQAGRTISVLALEIENDQIAAIRIIRNPDKLGRIRPTGSPIPMLAFGLRIVATAPFRRARRHRD